MAKRVRDKSTLALAMIMKDEVADLDRILTDYGQYFDAVYVTVTHKPTYRALLKRYGAKKNSAASLSYFAWCDHYGKARLYNQQQIKTDYWMWIDLDDEIRGAEKIPSVVKQMAKHKLDMVLFPYDYYQNAFGDSESMLWRERIIKTNPDITWEDKARHETVVAPSGAKTKQLRSIVIKHSKPIEQKLVEIIKTRPLLEREWQKDQHPQTAMYLGASYLAEQAFGNALQMFEYAAEHGTSELQLRAWASIADVYLMVKSYDEALVATDRAIALDPDFPDPWYQRTLAYMSLGAYGKAAETADIALGKRPDEQNIMAQDPTKYTYKGLFLEPIPNLPQQIQRPVNCLRNLPGLAILSSRKRRNRHLWQYQKHYYHVQPIPVTYPVTGSSSSRRHLSRPEGKPNRGRWICTKSSVACSTF